MEEILELINNNKFEDIIKLKDFNKIKLNENYLIHLLAIRGNQEGLDFFIKHKSFDLNISNDLGFNIIHLLFKYGWDDLAQKYYKILPDLLTNIDKDLYYPIAYCVDRFDTFLECFNFMNKNKDILLIDILNNVSLMSDNIIIKLIKKSQNNDKDVYLKFLKDNIDLIDFSKPKNTPPLMFSIYLDKNLLAQFFIENNKGIDVKNYQYQLPISMSVSKNNIEITKLLIKKETDLIYGGLDNEFIPLNIAINNDFLDLAEILINHNKKYDIIDNYKNTPLHYLADNLIKYYKNNQKDLEKKAIELIKILVDKSDIDFPNNDGLTVRKLLESYLKVRKNKKDGDISKLNKSINSIEKKDYNLIESDVDIIKSNKKYNTGLFNTDVFHNIFYVLYLLKKYDNLTIPYQKYVDKNYNEDNHDLIMQSIGYDKFYQMIYDIYSMSLSYLYPTTPWLILWKDRDLHYIHKDLFSIVAKLSKDKKIRFIMIKISLIVSVQFTHANMIMIDLKDNSVRRFEPYGISDVNDEEYLDTLLKDNISNALNKKVKYYRPNDYLEITKFQSVSNDHMNDYRKSGDPMGYCLAWCLWYVELKLNNPDLSEIELIETASKKITKYYKKSNNPYLSFIRDYSRKLNEEKDKVLKSIKINVNELYDVNYKVSNLKKILEYLKKYFTV
jgi:hypothetical protein